MPTIIKEYENLYLENNLGSHIRHKNLPKRVNCDFVCQTEPSCDNCDKHWSYYVADEDIIFLQFRLADEFNQNPTNPAYGWNVDGSAHWLDIDLMNSNGTVAQTNLTDETQDFVIGHAVGYHDGMYFQNVNIKYENIKDLITGDCFYFRIKVCEKPPTADFVTFDCVADPVPATTDGYLNGWNYLFNDIMYLQDNGTWTVVTPAVNDLIFCVVSGQWLSFVGGVYVIIEPPLGADGVCNDFKSCYTDLYRNIKCEKKTVQFITSSSAQVYLQGIGLSFISYFITDCTGRYYGDEISGLSFGTWYHLNMFRLAGSFENTSLNTAQERTEENQLISFETNEVKRLRLSPIPFSVASLVKSCFTTEKFFVDLKMWDDVQEINKNNDDDNMWHIDINLSRSICEDDKSCE